MTWIEELAQTGQVEVSRGFTELEETAQQLRESGIELHPESEDPGPGWWDEYYDCRTGMRCPRGQTAQVVSGVWLRLRHRATGRCPGGPCGFMAEVRLYRYNTPEEVAAAAAAKQLEWDNYKRAYGAWVQAEHRAALARYERNSFLMCAADPRTPQKYLEYLAAKAPTEEEIAALNALVPPLKTALDATPKPADWR